MLILVIEHMTHFKDKHAQLKFPQNYYSMNIVTISSRTKENLILDVCISYDKLAYTSLYCNLNNSQISSKQQLQTTKVYFLLTLYVYRMSTMRVQWKVLFYIILSLWLKLMETSLLGKLWVTVAKGTVAWLSTIKCFHLEKTVDTFTHVLWAKETHVAMAQYLWEM